MSDFNPYEPQRPPDTGVLPQQLTELFTEIRRYLEAVETFRSEGHEPRWAHDVLFEVLP